MAGLEKLDRRSVVVSAHAMVLQIIEYVQKTHGMGVGPVWVTATKNEPDEESARLGSPPIDMFVVRFTKGSRDLTLNVPVEMLAQDGVVAVGTIYDRLMGKRA